MKNIITMSRRKAGEFKSDESWAAIQIATYEDWWPRLITDNLKGKLQLFFDDLDVEVGPNWNATGEIKLFSSEQAKSVLNFVESVKDNIDTLLVHCEAGISRSTGMAAALNRIYFGDDGKWFETHSPNRLVYRMMLETAGLNIIPPESKDLSHDDSDFSEE